MVEVKLKIEESGIHECYGCLCHVECQGHATGNAMACAMVGQVMQMLAKWAQDYSHEDLLDIKVESGHSYVVFSGDGSACEVFLLIQGAFEQLENTFPEYVKIVEKPR